MTLALSTVLLSLAWFAAVNAAGSVIAWRLAMHGETAAIGTTRTGARATRLLALRLMPVVTAAVIAGLLFMPAHIALEPSDPRESFGLVVYALAFVAVALLLRSAYRVGAVVRAARRLRRCAGASVPAGGITGTDVREVGPVSGISLAGILRPRILVGRSARLALTPAELEIAVAHELAHRRAHDNIKRFLMLCAPDFFGTTAAARRLESQWRAEAECLADAVAVRGDAERAAALASALVKVARLGRETGGASYSAAWSTFHDPALLESRVRRLVASGVPDACPPPLPWRGTLATAALAAGAWLLGAPAILHHLTELAVQTLP